MAYVKSVKGGIKCSKHLCSAIEYITQPSKTYKSECINCKQGTAYQISEQFYMMQILHQKSNGEIHAHHFEQSFPPNENITPELAFTLGKEFVEKVFPGYQVVMSTHIDKNHIHNHFVVNAISCIGNRYYSNTQSLTFARNISDELCRKYNLNVIDTNKKFKGIDQTTYQLGVKGKSWKIKLTQDLDEALNICKSKSEFISFMESRDYIVNYQNVHITFKKKGEKKGIRTKKLSEQFGQKYSKSNIDKILGVIQTSETYEKSSNRKKNKTKYKSEYKRLEEKYFKLNPPPVFEKSESWTMSKNIFKNNPFLFTLKLIHHIFLKNKRKYCRKDKPCSYSKQPLKRITSQKDIYACKSNISYKQLKSAPGETVQIKIYAWQLPKLLSQSFFYHSFIDIEKGIATVYLKQKDLTKLAKALELTDESFFVKQSEKIQNRKTYAELKKENKTLNYLLITNEQKETLKNNFIKFAFIERDDKLKISFAPKDKKRIIQLLYPEQAKEKINTQETTYQKNGRINAELKEIAKQTGDKICYKIISSTQLHLLEKSNIKFASFRTENGMNNVVFLESKLQKVDEILQNNKNTENKNINTRR